MVADLEHAGGREVDVHGENAHVLPLRRHLPHRRRRPPPKQQDWEEGVGERKKWSSTSTYRSGSSEEEVDVMRVLLSHRSVLYTPPTVHAASSFSPFIYHGVFFFLCVWGLFFS